MGSLARIGARAMHVALYALLIALPLSGWLAASSEGAHLHDHLIRRMLPTVRRKSLSAGPGDG